VASKLNITIDQGSDVTFDIELEDSNGIPLDITTYTARSMLRKHYQSTNSISFTCDTTSNGANGILILSLTANQTANIVAGRYVYDIELVSEANVVTRVIEGLATITPEVTKQ